MAAKKATTTVPIVVISGDPVAAGLVASLAKPGGNVTGIANQLIEVPAKAIQTFLEAVPGISEIGYLVRPDNPSVVQGWQAVNAVAPRLGVKLRRFDVSQPDELERAIATMARERIGGMVVPADDRFTAQRDLIGALAAKNRLPWLAGWPHLVEAGALMSYGPDLRHQWQRVVWYVDRILKGAKPADLPVEQPTKFELVINLKTAKALGLTIPPSVLLRAGHVIQ
jgi:putative tryptophan/tyrosine transport system substrate-binding protein